MPILPMSCSSAPRRMWTSSASPTPMARARRRVISVTRRLWPSVSWSRRSSARDQPSMRGVVGQGQLDVGALQALRTAWRCRWRWPPARPGPPGNPATPASGSSGARWNDLQHALDLALGHQRHGPVGDEPLGVARRRQVGDRHRPAQPRGAAGGALAVAEGGPGGRVALNPLRRVPERYGRGRRPAGRPPRRPGARQASGRGRHPGCARGPGSRPIATSIRRMPPAASAAAPGGRSGRGSRPPPARGRSRPASPWRSPPARGSAGP